VQERRPATGRDGIARRRPHRSCEGDPAATPIVRAPASGARDAGDDERTTGSITPGRRRRALATNREAMRAKVATAGA
jgi:hypothetical protein